MVKKVITHIKYPVLFVLVVFCLIVMVQVVLGSNIDPTDRWAWGANVGWIDFAPDGYEGVIVYADHLEGYAWGENVGWIRVGAHTGGGSHTYANDAASNYGVNVDGSGNLSGYGWGASVGWINFDPDGSEQVTIDLDTGEFDGYAWGENIGWIRCQGTADNDAAYNVVINPDLEIAKQATARVNPGGTVTYTLVFTNHGPVRATGIVITDRVPVSVTVVSRQVASNVEITPTGSISYVWKVENLDADKVGVITITGVLSDPLPGGHVFGNHVEIAADADSDSSNDIGDADVTVTDAKLKITKDVSDSTPDPGATIVYTVIVTNSADSDDDATGVVVSDTLSVDITNVSFSVTRGEYVNPVWDVGDLGIGVSATLRITGTVRADAPDGTIIANTAVISASDQGDSGPEGDHENDANIVVNGAEMALVKTVDNPTPNEGEYVTYAITVTNDGSASTVVVSDVLPSGVSYVSDDSDDYDGNGKWDVGELVNGESKTLHITALVDVGTAGTTVTNTAAITETSLADPDPSDNADEASIKPRGANLEVGKTVNDRTPNEGSSIVYTVTVTNHGPADTVGVVISDVLPSGVSHQSHAGNYDETTGVWNVDDLVSGVSATLRITVGVNVGTADQTIVNTAVVSESDRTDLFPSNDQDDAFIVAQAADAVAATITPDEGGTLNCGATITVPTNAVTDSITLICTPVSTPISVPSGWLFAGHAFNLDVYLEGVLQPGFAFTRPVTITIHYSDEDVAGLIEDELVLEYWNGETWEDAACGEYEYHPDENWMTVPICHLTPFALLGKGFPIGGMTVPASPWLRFTSVVMVAIGAITAAALKRRAA